MLITLQHKIARSTKTGCTCHNLDLFFYFFIFATPGRKVCFSGLAEKIFWTVCSSNTDPFFFLPIKGPESVVPPAPHPVLLCICLAMSADLSRRQRQSRPAGSTTCLCYLRCPARARATLPSGRRDLWQQNSCWCQFCLEVNRAASLPWRGPEHSAAARRELWRRGVSLSPALRFLNERCHRHDGDEPINTFKY